MTSVPCPRCGAAVPGSFGTLCARCAPPDAWTVQIGTERVRLGREELKARLLAGTAAGTDHVVDGAEAVPVAAHPVFRSWFLAGHPDALALPEKRKRWWMFGLG